VLLCLGLDPRERRADCAQGYACVIARGHGFRLAAEDSLAFWAAMTYIIVGTCIKDDSCVEVCPVDCIHPKPGAPDFETAEQLYIDPAVCIDCDACVEACPVDAIFADFGLPEKFGYAVELNAEFFAEKSTAERTAA
jgi:ferredoxin